MQIASVNILAVLAAAIASFAINFVWFTMLFRRMYVEGLGKTQSQMDQGPSMAVASGLQLAGFALMAFVLGWLMERLDLGSVPGGLVLAIIVWLGFLVAIIGPMHAFQAFPLRFSLITLGGYLLALLATAVILGAWR